MENPKDSGGGEMVLDLSNHLDVHHLDVTPDQDQSSIEFVVHATLDASEEEVEALTNSRLTMDELVCSVDSVESE